jgi:starch synthase
VRGVLETVKKLRWAPDVIHCHGWMTALTALYVKKAYNEDPFFKDAKIVYSIYDDEFKKPFNSYFAEHLMLDGVEKTDLTAIQTGEINYESVTKLALDHADGVILTHENVSPEITKHINQKGLPNITCTDKEDYVQSYLDFYDSLFK